MSMSHEVGAVPLEGCQPVPGSEPRATSTASIGRPARMIAANFPSPSRRFPCCTIASGESTRYVPAGK